jgi:uncharacterized membrane protein YhhN
LTKIPFPAFTFFYTVVAIIAIGADSLDLKWTYYLSKPVLLISLLILFRIMTKKSGYNIFRALITGAILLSIIGDILMMFSPESDNYFLAGLGTFLVVHFFYTAAFTYDIFQKRVKEQHWGQLAISTLMVVYSAEFYILNRYSFGSMWLPVMIYCIAISLMGISAIMRGRYHNPAAYYRIVTGALLFIVADSFIALDKFVIQFDFSGVIILGTYFAAQYLICIGCIRVALQKAPVTWDSGQLKTGV